MKTIGLLGGTSWPSTMLYYKKINELVNSRLGSYHSAKIFLYSIDYNTIKNAYLTLEWEIITDQLNKEISQFLATKPDCLVLCNNTLHKSFDFLKEDLQLKIPFFHAGELIAQKANKNNYKSVLLLGTKLTMEDGFFAEYFMPYNIKVYTPNEQDRMTIQEIQTQISQNKKSDHFYSVFYDLLIKYKNIDAICLACTELPLYINSSNSEVPILNPIDEQCLYAVDYALQ